MPYKHNSYRFIPQGSTKIFFLVVTISILSVFLLLSSCERDIGGEALAKKITEYYRLEQQNKWDLAYQVRSPEFRRAVSKNDYVDTMLKDNQGWKLKEASRLSMFHKGKQVHVRMRFVELAPPQYSKRLGLPHILQEVTFEEIAIWEKIDDVWFCVEPGERSHLPLKGNA